jgi:hypothetical protein
MPTRGLTPGESAVLRSVFGETLPYDTQQITTNDANRGGANNSITYDDTPHYSNLIWCSDFSASDADTWTFVHEFGHVWQSKYGTPPILGWLANVARMLSHLSGDYGITYPYDLTSSGNFWDYNIEQQASIVADYWAVMNSKSAHYCTNPSSPSAGDYAGFINQVKNANAPPPAPAPINPYGGELPPGGVPTDAGS